MHALHCKTKIVFTPYVCLKITVIEVEWGQYFLQKRIDIQFENTEA